MPDDRMRRGEIWQYDAVLQAAAGHRLVITSDAVLEHHPSLVLTLPIDPVGKRTEDLLSVEVAGYGWVNALVVDSTIARRLTRCVATVDADTWESVAVRLRTVLGDD